MLGILLFIVYIAIGIFIADKIFDKKPLVKIWLGSVLGLLGLMWSNVPFSFILGFTQTSHWLGLVFFTFIAFMIYIFSRKNNPNLKILNLKAKITTEEKIMLLITIPFLLVVFQILYTHTLYNLDGAMWTGQATYGDMSMHLGFITSIAKQGMFPPTYSILPGELLKYPFLCDTISSSLYIFGTSLKVSYILPMMLAFLLVFTGFWFLADSILGRVSKTFTAFILFFLNGGFGLIYFLDKLKETPSNFTRIFTDYYTTPTNLIDNGIRWSNVIVDMLIPQRATLFGWMVLFAALYLLYQAVFTKNNGKNKTYFITAGIFGGLLPMIHTHSFFALGMIAVCWLIYVLYRERSKKGFMDCLCFGLPAIILAVPQLITWTFKYVNGNSSIVFSPDWCNLDENWLWFWVKNVGLVFILLPFAFFNSDKKKKILYSGAILIFVVADLFVFQPNTYDNNKLFYIWYVYTVIIVADFIIDVYKKIKGFSFKGLTVALALVFIVCTNAGVLTLMREINSGIINDGKPQYELYSKGAVEAADFISKNTLPTDTFLSDSNHNNVIACLTGRNIVCGSSLFLYYHGVDYSEEESLRVAAFTDIEAFENERKNGVFNYVYISNYEKNQFNDPKEAALKVKFTVVEKYIQENYKAVFQNNEVTIYKVE
jgi:hypothetical protein